MDRTTLLKEVSNLNVWKRGDERASNKPLLLLLAVSDTLAGKPRLQPYTRYDRPLYNLLEEFGPPRHSYHPEYPFWFLQTDGLWEVPESEGLVSRKGNVNPSRRELIAKAAVGGLPENIYQSILQNPQLGLSIAQEVANAYFPESLHDEIFLAVGLDIVSPSDEHPGARDPAFRPSVLATYAQRCVICGLSVQIGTRHFALEACHIKWRQYGGPDSVPNGLAMCVIHHKAFDRGALCITDDLEVRISLHLSGNEHCYLLFHQWHGKLLPAALRRGDSPAPEFLAWHRKQVFRAPAIG